MTIGRAWAWISVALAACVVIRVGTTLIEPIIPTLALLVVLAFVAVLMIGPPRKRH